MAKLKSEIKRHELMRKMDVPVTSKMLSGTREELKANTSSLRFEMKASFSKVESRFFLVDAKFNKVDARFDQVEARFKEVDSRFNQVESRFKDMDARFDNVDTKLQSMTDEIHRLGVMIEEQNARNAIVLDGLQNLFERQERIEKKVEALT